MLESCFREFVLWATPHPCRRQAEGDGGQPLLLLLRVIRGRCLLAALLRLSEAEGKGHHGAASRPPHSTELHPRPSPSPTGPRPLQDQAVFPMSSPNGTQAEEPGHCPGRTCISRDTETLLQSSEAPPAQGGLGQETATAGSPPRHPTGISSATGQTPYSNTPKKAGMEQRGKQKGLIENNATVNRSPGRRIRQRHHYADKGPSSQSYGFSSSRVWM